jgi:hypothetical protein
MPPGFETISTLELPRRKDGTFVVAAFCPVCDRVEEAAAGQGLDRARQMAIAKILAHGKRRHAP